MEYCEKNEIRWDFGIIVIDELSSFKNYQSQRFKFLRKARSHMKRWGCLIGTPSSGVVFRYKPKESTGKLCCLSSGIRGQLRYLPYLQPHSYEPHILSSLLPE